MYILALVLPVSLVADDVLQILVALDVFRAHYIRSLLDYLFRQSDLSRNFDGEGRAWSADGKLEEGLHLVAVVKHRAVYHALVTISKMLQVLIVGGDDAVSLLLAELVEHGLGDGSTDARFGTGTKLIYQYDGVAIGCLHHVLHVQKMGRVGTQVVFQTLLVADINHDVLEDTRLRTLAHRDTQSALQHILQQTYCLEAHRLTTGVRTRYDEDALVLRQGDIKRHHFFVFLLQGLLEQWVDGTDPVYVWMVGHFRLYRLEHIGYFLLRPNQVDDGEEAVALQDFLGEWAHLVGEIGEDADNLLSFLAFQLAHPVVGFHHLGWFYEHGLTGGTLVVNDTLDSSLQGRDYWDNQSAVAQGRGYVFLYYALALGSSQYAVEGA